MESREYNKRENGQRTVEFFQTMEFIRMESISCVFYSLVCYIHMEQSCTHVAVAGRD